MNKLNIDESSAFFKVLIEPPRLRVLNILLHNDWVASPDLTLTLDAGQQYMFRHLQILENHGVVRKVKQGVPTFFDIHPDFREMIEHAFTLVNDEQLQLDLLVYREHKKYEYFEEDKRDKAKRYAIIQLMQSEMPPKAVAQVVDMKESEVNRIFNDYLKEREKDKEELEKLRGERSMKDIQKERKRAAGKRSAELVEG